MVNFYVVPFLSSFVRNTFISHEDIEVRIKCYIFASYICNCFGEGHSTLFLIIEESMSYVPEFVNKLFCIMYLSAC